MPSTEPPYFLPQAFPPGSMPLLAEFHRALVMSLDWSVSKFIYNNLKARAERIQITVRRDLCHNFTPFPKTPSSQGFQAHRPSRAATTLPGKPLPSPPLAGKMPATGRATRFRA
jgi:hypothetical protein